MYTDRNEPTSPAVSEWYVNPVRHWEIPGPFQSVLRDTEAVLSEPVRRDAALERRQDTEVQVLLITWRYGNSILSLLQHDMTKHYINQSEAKGSSKPAKEPSKDFKSFFLNK